MADYIERQAAINVLEERLHANGYSNVALVSELNRSIGYLMRLSSADVVEVVRCKECKHNPKDTWFECPLAHLPVHDDRWCWKGERKDG